MARVVFFSLPLHGHVNPSLPLVRELVSRGEEVVYYATDPFAGKIEQAGATYRPYRNAFLADLRALPEQTNELPWRLTQAAADVLDAELAALRGDAPSYIITDSVAPWGQWAGQILRVPVVTSVSTFAFNRRVLAYAAAHGVRPRSLGGVLSKIRHVSMALGLGARLRRRYGVRGPGVVGAVFGHSDLNIVYTSRLFQPRSESFDDRFAFVGPSMDARTETADFEWDQMRRPIIYVSLGTLFNSDSAFYRTCFEAFRGQDLQVIVSIGTSVSPESLGVPPPNVAVRSHVAQLDVLRHASAFVTHGGMNSVSESLYFGVPVVVVPHMGEQAIVGQRVAEVGAGLYLAKEAVTVARLGERVQRLLSEEAFRLRAASVGESLREAGGVRRAADAILTFAGRAEKSA